jgi:NAD-dependent dihydropyrimidine dehydrogenase PreA subunit
MRNDATFIGIEVSDEVVGDADLAQMLQDACPVDIYANAGGKVEIVESNIDECILCELCIHAAPDGTVQVHKLYSGETLGAASA